VSRRGEIARDDSAHATLERFIEALRSARVADAECIIPNLIWHAEIEK
jgi:hypothetical protein